MVKRTPRLPRARRAFLSLMLLALTCSLSPRAPAAESASPAPAPADAESFFAAIVKIESRALPDARSAATLGTEREGTGVIIARDGLTLTIGYLLIEADEVRIVDGRGRTLPARVVAYDHVSGLGLVRPMVPLEVAPIALGDSSRLAASDPVLIVNRGGRDEATRALVVSRRMFTGNWEYLLESAIFTSPPTLDWSGAALIGTDGALLGVGSLILRDATDDEPHVPGNMFVPIEVLKPILADLVGNGRRSGPVRPWLGVAADEEHGRLVVVRVSPGGPSDNAGIRPGDIILAVGGEGVHSQAEFYRKLWAKRIAGATVPLRVLQGIDVHEVKVRSIDRFDYFKQKPTY